MNEAYLQTARNRVSLARHARLVDYQIHQGNQASTLLAVRVVADAVVSAPPLAVSTGDPSAATGATFVTVEQCTMLAALNDPRYSVYTWDDTRTALASGDTSVDLAVVERRGGDRGRGRAVDTTPAPSPQTVPPTSPPRLLLLYEGGASIR